MSSNTNFLDLLMKDPVANKDDTFNIETMLNENWRKIDTLLGMLAGHGDNLAKLSPAAKYMDHWWHRRLSAPNWSIVLGNRITPKSTTDTEYYIFYILNGTAASTDEGTVTYADAVKVDDDGAVKLVDPVTITTTYSSFNSDGLPELLQGKYVSRAHPAHQDRNPIYIPEGATFAREYGSASTYGYRCYPNAFYDTFAVPPEWEEVHSENREAYPDNSVIGEHEYRYIGVPMSRLPFGLRVAVGSYTGVGAYGDDNPNVLAFDFKPLLVFLDTGSSDNYSSQPLYYILTRPSAQYQLPGLNKKGTVVWADAGVSWYSESTDESQFNVSGKEYHYIAIG